MFATQSQFAAVGRGKKREMVDNYKNIIPSVILEIINTGGGGDRMGQCQRIANMAKARVVLSGGAIAYRGVARW